MNKEALYHHFHYGYPHCHEDDRPYQKYGNHVCTEEEWEQLCRWLTGDPTFRSKVERHRKELREMKALADIKPDASPLLAAQAAHPPLLAPLIATGPPTAPTTKVGSVKGT